MPESFPTRRLAAILCADVAGYSRMVQADEEGTLADLRSCRLNVFEPAIVAGGGRIVKYLGDGFLAEFPSAVNAVSAALDLQSRMTSGLAGAASVSRITLRIGINLGDIVGDGEDILGDGVNVAARLEPLAEPGGIVVSGKVRDEVAGKIAVDFIDMGEKWLKNMNSVRAFRVAGTMARTMPAAAVLVDPRLSVAVLPFTSLSADLDHQYLGDGISEDIITELARLPILRLSARNSSFRFRGPDADLSAAARELNVRFLVEGSLRRLGTRVRITAQLIDISTGAHLWAERYDRATDALDEMQDDVVRNITGTLLRRLQAVWVEETKRKPLTDQTALDLAMLAENMPWSSSEAVHAAIAVANRAVELDPRLARAQAVLSMLLSSLWLVNFAEADATLDQALAHARIASSLDANDPYSHTAVASAALYLQNFDLAEFHIARARQLNPSSTGVLSVDAHFLLLKGDAESARERLETAMALDPGFSPSWLWGTFVTIEYIRRRYPAAISAFHRAEDVEDWSRAYVAAAYAMQGEHIAAAMHKQRLLDYLPDFTIEALLRRDGFQKPTDREHVAEGMRRAGLPD